MDMLTHAETLVRRAKSRASFARAVALEVRERSARTHKREVRRARAAYRAALEAEWTADALGDLA